MDGGENLVQAEAVFHGQHVFGQQVAGVFADDGRAEDLVLARYREHLDETVRGAVGDGAVELVEAVACQLERNALFPGFGL